MERKAAGEVKLTRRAIAEFIRWSRSRYNDHKKTEVVDLAYRMLRDGGRWQLRLVHAPPSDAEWRPGPPLRNPKAQAKGLFWAEVWETTMIVPQTSRSTVLSGGAYRVDGAEHTLSRGRVLEGVFVAEETLTFAVSCSTKKPAANTTRAAAG